MKKRLATRVLVAGFAVIIITGVGLAALISTLGHRFYTVAGDVHIEGTASSRNSTPFVICMWETTYGSVASRVVNGTENPDGRATIVCRVPAVGLDVPFRETRYSMYRPPMLLGAFLQPLGESTPVCAANETIMVNVEDLTGRLAAICQHAELPPESEMALLAPYSDEPARPTSELAIRVLHAD